MRPPKQGLAKKCCSVVSCPHVSSRTSRHTGQNGSPLANPNIRSLAAPQLADRPCDPANPSTRKK